MARRFGGDLNDGGQSYNMNRMLQEAGTDNYGA